MKGKVRRGRTYFPVCKERGRGGKWQEAPFTGLARSILESHCRCPHFADRAMETVGPGSWLHSWGWDMSMQGAEPRAAGTGAQEASPRLHGH